MCIKTMPSQYLKQYALLSKREPHWFQYTLGTRALKDEKAADSMYYRFIHAALVLLLTAEGSGTHGNFSAKSNSRGSLV